MAYYPDLPDGVIWSLDLIRKAVAADKDYFDQPDCPYPDDEKAVLKAIFGVSGRRAAVREVETGPDFTRWDTLEEETARLYRDLIDERNNLDVKDNAERMSYFRTATSLLEKLIGLQERAANLRQVHNFYDTVLRVMEDVLTVDQRTEVMTKLKEAAGK